jgi:hypothetical protein
MQQVDVASLDLLAYRVHLIEEMRRAGAKGTTFLDFVIAVHIYTFRAHGTRPQTLIDYLDASRWTIRDSIDRLERNAVIVREHRLYYPTRMCADLANAESDAMLSKVGRLCDAVAELRKDGA